MTVPLTELRRFNRFYTRQIGLLNEHLLDSPFTLAEARVLYEIAHRVDATAADLSRELRMDKAQLSRVLARCRARGLVAGVISPAHARHRLLSLTTAGRAAVAALEKSADAQLERLMAPLDAAATRQLTEAVATVQRLLERAEAGEAEPLPFPGRRGGSSFALREPKIGDLGLVVQRQALLYAEEYDWDWTFEGLLADILGRYAATCDASREQAWIADCDGAIAGSVFLMRGSDDSSAKLRLLYVERDARGLGIGRALVDACIARAREIGYRRLDLWTQDCLVAARRLYAAAGFELVASEPHRSFGKDLVGETWSLDLTR